MAKETNAIEANRQHPKQIMCIGRSDCLGRTGIQTDVKTIMALGNYATTVVTSVYANHQDTPFDANECTTTLIVRQMEEIITTVRPDCVKIGRLYSSEQVNLIERTLQRHLPDIKIVMAPILVGPNDVEYQSVRALSALKRDLAVHTDLLVLSHREAEIITGAEIKDEDDLDHVATMILSLGCQAVLIAGVQLCLEDETHPQTVIDILATMNGIERFRDIPNPLINHPGAKTTLASACASYLADGLSIQEAVVKGREFMCKALADHVHIPVLDN